MSQNSDVYDVSVEVSFSVKFNTQEGGWVSATCRYGSCTARSKEECIRILKQRVKGI